MVVLVVAVLVAMVMVKIVKMSCFFVGSDDDDVQSRWRC